MTKQFNQAMLQVADSAKESLLNCIKEHGEFIQLPYDEVQESHFYSGCNGSVIYLVAKLYDDGELLCVEEGSKWDDGVVLEDNNECPVEISAIMGVGELDLYSLCQLSDFINKNYGHGATNYAEQYKALYDQVYVILRKIEKPMEVNSENIEVQHINEECDVVSSHIGLITDNHLLTSDWETVTFSEIPMDDLALLVDKLMEKGLL